MLHWQVAHLVYTPSRHMPVTSIQQLQTQNKASTGHHLGLIASIQKPMLSTEYIVVDLRRITYALLARLLIYT